jgi:hypothetical protein
MHSAHGWTNRPVPISDSLPSAKSYEKYLIDLSNLLLLAAGNDRWKPQDCGRFSCLKYWWAQVV